MNKKFIVDESDRKYIEKVYGDFYPERAFLILRLTKIQNETNAIPPIEDWSNGADGSIKIRYKWVDGIELGKILEESTEDEQTLYGKKLAVLLKKIHAVKVAEPHDNWGRWYVDHCSRIMKRVESIEDFYKDKVYELFMQEAYYVFSSESHSYTHGDVSWDNIVVRDGELYLIDWDNIGIRNPWFDLLGSFEHLEDYKAFLVTLIWEYFDGSIPDDFKHFYKAILCGQVLDFLLYESWNPNGDIAYALTKLRDIYDYLLLKGEG